MYLKKIQFIIVWRRSWRRWRWAGECNESKKRYELILWFFSPHFHSHSRVVNFNFKNFKDKPKSAHDAGDPTLAAKKLETEKKKRSQSSDSPQSDEDDNNDDDDSHVISKEKEKKNLNIDDIKSKLKKNSSNHDKRNNESSKSNDEIEMKK